ncbi:MAG: type II toxin-antitoxin system HicB family antitoxin [Fretibacterium sp.]|nr:type II toxin-antitoxin system HicB family antitoxin [Fretibacterium sp.]
MKNYYTMLIERDEEGWYVGSVPSLPGCHTQGRTIDELISNMEEALSLYAEEEYVASPIFAGSKEIA